MKQKYISYIKYAFYITIFLLVCFWRPGSKDKTDSIANTTSSIAENKTEKTSGGDNFCDENKIKDFKNNLTKSPNSLSQKNIEKIDKAVKEFMEQYCALEPTLCKPYENRYHEVYNTVNPNIQLALSAYLLKDAPIDDEKGGHIKVISIFEKGDMAQYFILDDLMGEILVELSGFEGDLAQFSIWGASFPYFVPEYGKFKISNNKGTFSIIHECLVN